MLEETLSGSKYINRSREAHKRAGERMQKLVKMRKHKANENLHSNNIQAGEIEWNYTFWAEQRTVTWGLLIYFK